MLPLKLEDLTTEWLTQALCRHTSGARVAAIREQTVIGGTTTKILFDLVYEGTPASLPQSICIKGGFDEALRPLVGDAYLAEANFFEHIAPTLEVPMPRCWFAAADAERRQGIVILDNLAKAGAYFGDPTQPWAVDRVAAGLEVQAQWHAQTWGATLKRYPVLHPGSWVRVPAAQLFGEANWARAFDDRTHAARIPPAWQSRARVSAAFDAMWGRDDHEGTPCMIHGDPHIGNTFVDAAGQPGFLDWQSASIAPAMDDVAYFLVGALSVADRRAHERQLFNHYLDALQARLGQVLDRDAVWLDYRRHCLHGFIWAVVPPQMQSPACVTAMTERYVAAVVDHDVLALI